MNPSEVQSEQEATEPKTNAFSLSPERVVKAKAGVLISLAGCLITCTIYVVRMDMRQAQMSEDIQAIKNIGTQHAIVWEWYNRTASRGVVRQVGP